MKRGCDKVASLSAVESVGGFQALLVAYEELIVLNRCDFLVLAEVDRLSRLLGECEILIVSVCLEVVPNVLSCVDHPATLGHRSQHIRIDKLFLPCGVEWPHVSHMIAERYRSGPSDGTKSMSGCVPRRDFSPQCFHVTHVI